MSVVVGEESDTSRSSFLLNMFTDEEHSVYVDIDASQAGNEARFINDFHGTGQVCCLSVDGKLSVEPYLDPLEAAGRRKGGRNLFGDFGNGNFFERRFTRAPFDKWSTKS